MWHIAVNSLNGIHVFVSSLHDIKFVFMRLSAHSKVFETLSQTIVFSTLGNFCIINAKDYVNFHWCLLFLMFMLWFCLCGIWACQTRFTVICWSHRFALFYIFLQRNGYWSGDGCLSHYVLGGELIPLSKWVPKPTQGVLPASNPKILVL